MISPTYGQVNMDEIVHIIGERFLESPEKDFSFTIGTDSQNITNMTKLVSVIAIYMEQKGGFFFYQIEKILPPFKDIHTKVLAETKSSLELATNFIKSILESGREYLYEIPITIHCDLGEEGPSKSHVSEIVGWVNACGFDCEIKPDAFAASTIANKISK